MGFITPIFLAGLAGASLPLLIHLLNREKPRQVVFGWRPFLLKAHQAHSRRFKLRELLLLLLRMLLCALLALAFARPFWANAAPIHTPLSMPTYAVIVLDLSYSMQYGDWFNKAKKRVDDILDDLTEGDQVALLGASNQVQVILNWSADRAAVKRAVQRLEPTFEIADLGAAFRSGEAMLGNLSGVNKALYLISDHQAESWWRLDRGDRTRPGIVLGLEDIAGDQRDNLSLSDVQLLTTSQNDNQAWVAARLHYYGQKTRRDVSVELVIDDQLIHLQEVDLDTTGTAVVQFKLPETRQAQLSGWIGVSGDALEADNRHYFSVRPPRLLRTLCVDGKSSTSQSTTYFLERALNPWGKTHGRLAPTQTIRPGQLDSTRLADKDVVFLSNLPLLAPPALSALQAFVQQGGGLVIVAGPRSRLNLGEMLPVTKARPLAVPPEEGFALFVDIAYDHPLFTPFRLKKHGDFGQIRTTAYLSVEHPEASNPNVLMRYDPGDPALIEYRYGSGKILLFTSSFDATWTDLPKRTLFPALVHQMVRYLSDDLEAASTSAYRIGERPSESDPPFERPGIFRLQTPLGERHVTVNLDPREADLQRVNLDSLRLRLRPALSQANSAASGPAAPDGAVQEKQQRLWWYILLAALALAMAEVVFANRI